MKNYLPENDKMYLRYDYENMYTCIIQQKEKKIHYNSENVEIFPLMKS